MIAKLCYKLLGYAFFPKRRETRSCRPHKTCASDDLPRASSASGARTFPASVLRLVLVRAA